MMIGTERENHCEVCYGRATVLVAYTDRGDEISARPFRREPTERQRWFCETCRLRLEDHPDTLTFRVLWPRQS